jgi:uncharacterized membrane protein YfcA
VLSPVVLPVGLLIGLSLGALGGGGSRLTVPALVYLLGQEPHEATTASLLIVGASSLGALVPHARRGNVRFGQGLVFGALGITGSWAGSAAALRVQPAVLLTAFAVLMLVVAALMLQRSLRPDGSRQPPATRAQAGGLPRAVKVLLTASLVGLVTGFFGVGGGFVLVPALVLALSFRMPVAVGTSLLVIAVNSATALAARATSGSTRVDWALVGVFTAVAVTGSLLGSRLAAQAPQRILGRAFVVLLVAVAVYTAAQNVPALF